MGQASFAGQRRKDVCRPPQGKLTIIASDITNGKILILPDDLAKIGLRPESFEVARAVRMSCSIPYFFDPVLLRLPPKLAKGKPFSEQFLHIVDGGLLSNFPLWLFDQETPRSGERIPTVGFQMVGKNTNQPHDIRGPFSMLQAIVETMLSAHDERYIEQSNRYRTIKIPTLGFPTTQFDISEEESLLLYESGLRAGERFSANGTPNIMRSNLTNISRRIRALLNDRHRRPAKKTGEIH
ncbi:hypothetical protein HMSSN036_09320 [Paenibacillus macerans]|nr:hypothetical protein HMSSN036_09320 [Paenibacillus macerans]